MNRLSFAAVVVAIAASGAATAVAQQQQATTSPVTLSGCIATGQKNGYLLTKAELINEAMAASAAAPLGVPRPVGTAGRIEVEPAGAKQTTYALDSPFKLKAYVGQKVEIAGTAERSDPANAAAGPKLKVRTVKMLEKGCR